MADITLDMIDRAVEILKRQEIIPENPTYVAPWFYNTPEVREYCARNGINLLIQDGINPPL